MNIRKHIPNTITLGNLFCGCLALVSAFKGDLIWAAYFVGIALVLDFFDGFAARLLHVSSAIGKDLDSLADMVTFGVVPGVVMFQMINFSISASIVPEPGLLWSNTQTVFPISYLAFILTLFSCIRLAKFNNDTRQSHSFIGLPTPANAMIICSFPLITAFQPDLIFVLGLIQNVTFLVILSLVLSYLLIAEIPLFALKFKTYNWSDNKMVYSFLAISVLLLFSLKFIAVPLICVLYILISIVNNIFLKKEH